VKSVTGRELAKALERSGWVLLRVYGSHHIYGKQGRRERISVPIHGNAAINAVLLAQLMKVAEIAEKDL